MASKGNVKVYITGDADGLRRATGDAESALGRLSSTGGRALRALGTAAGVATGALTAGAIVFGKAAIQEATEAEKVGSQTVAVLKSTGAAAKVTADDVSNLAEKLSLKSGIDDEAIQTGQNLLLTFTNIRNEVGKGNAVFDEASKAALDMSVAMGTDMKAASLQVGKALNDPIKGVTALGRAGVQFSEEQRGMIEKLVESGDVLSAQKIILKELDTQFAGSAKAQATDAEKMQVAWANVQEEIGTMLLPTFNKVVRFINNKALPVFKDFAAGVASFIKPALDKIGDFGGKIIKAFDKVRSDAKERGIGPALSGMFVSAFQSIDWDKVGQTIGDGIQAAFDFSNKIVSAIATAINNIDWGVLVDGLIDGLEAAMSSGDKLASLLGGTFVSAIEQIKWYDLTGALVEGAAKMIAALTDPAFWVDHWKAILGIFVAVLLKGGLLKTAFSKIAPVFGKLMGGIGGKATDALLGVLTKLPGKVGDVILRVVLFAGKVFSALPGKLKAIVVAGGVALVRAIVGWIPDAASAVWDLAKKIFSIWAEIATFLPRKAFSIGKDVVGKLWDGVKNLPGLLKDIGGKAADFFVGAFKFVGSKVKAVFSGVVGAIKGVINAMIGAINSTVVAGFNKVFDREIDPPGPGPAFHGIHLSEIGYLARGGKLTSPQLIVAGEEAPRFTEFFISTNPRDKARSTALLLEAADLIGVTAFKNGGKRGGKDKHDKRRHGGFNFALEMAKADAALARAEQTDTLRDDLRALEKTEKAINKRLSLVKKALRKKPKPGQRTALLSEEAQLIRDRADIREQMKELRHPEEQDNDADLQAQLEQAQAQALAYKQQASLAAGVISTMGGSGDIGAGGANAAAAAGMPIVNINALTPGDPNVVRQAAAAVAAGWTFAGLRTPPRTAPAL